jgi:hypothetical protein
VKLDIILEAIVAARNCFTQTADTLYVAKRSH